MHRNLAGREMRREKKSNKDKISVLICFFLSSKHFCFDNCIGFWTRAASLENYLPSEIQVSSKHRLVKSFMLFAAKHRKIPSIVKFNLLILIWTILVEKKKQNPHVEGRISLALFYNVECSFCLILVVWCRLIQFFNCHLSPPLFIRLTYFYHMAVFLHFALIFSVSWDEIFPLMRNENGFIEGWNGLVVYYFDCG